MNSDELYNFIQLLKIVKNSIKETKKDIKLLENVIKKNNYTNNN